MTTTSTWTLTDHITKHMQKPRLGDLRPPSLWPSDASAVLTSSSGREYVEGSCRRHTFLRYTRDKFVFDNQTNIKYKPLVEELYEVQTEPERYMRWIWTAGNLFEEFIIEEAKKSGVYVASQLQVVIPTWNIIGKLDLIVSNPETGGLIAQEVKSIYGYYAEKEIVGTSSMRARGILGKPKPNNLMQAAIYNWHMKPRYPTLEATRLLYGDRGTGKDAEFNVRTEAQADGDIAIYYRGVAPFIASEVKSPITINNILNQYDYVLAHNKEGVLPPRDFDLSYNEEQIKELYEEDELSNTDKATYEKVIDRRKENQALILEGKKPKKELKLPSVAHWACSRCEFIKFCYEQDGTPRKE